MRARGTTIGRLGGVVAAAVLTLAACGSTGTPVAAKISPPPTANLKPPASIGAGEGQLKLIVWGGYVQPLWQKPFQDLTGCKITYQNAGSSEEMVSLMAGGGGGQWDMVSAPGDAALQLIYNGDVRPMNVNLIPDWQNFQDAFKSPSFNTVQGVHYGVTTQWGPNVLLYSTAKFPHAPTSWSVIYDTQNAGVITIPDNPIQIADAALYLSKHQPALGIADPYELTQKQFDATIGVLKQQRQLVKALWTGTGDEEPLFRSGAVIAGPAWPIMTTDLKIEGAKVAETIPQEGATGWADSWMLATNAPHPNCAYLWAKWVSTPQVQAEQALSYGETPVNTRACAVMESLRPGACADFHANAAASYFDTIKFWKTPLARCDDASLACVPYSQWQSAWASIKA